eukprot:CAMPEP_0116027462 /NCGR_PEP_ID=MMETSP0321-20121206/14663_1 /TAXON_ID=163516 /ORGANISM="Leptocylindrus danicus var. danicus, Strain B650" /LENGTH=507 /DNA_ID=CAMNT_0003500861 /DNA_START=231 /DNA_END=1754 /DNA_ORIENTATION=+
MVKKQVQTNGERTPSPTSVQDALFFTSINNDDDDDDENAKKKRSYYSYCANTTHYRLRRLHAAVASSCASHNTNKCNTNNRKSSVFVWLLILTSIIVGIAVILRSNNNNNHHQASYYGFPVRPMTIHIIDTSTNNKNKNNNKNKKERKIHLSRNTYKALYNPITSYDAMRGWSDPFLTEECQQSKDWQLTSFPSCNGVHEYDLFDVNTILINNGYWRDVWRVQDSMGNVEVLKMMRYAHEFEERNYDRHRRDAVAMERLTRSDHVVDIYGFCGNSGIFQYSEGGDVHNMVFNNSNRKKSMYSSVEMLKVAHEISQGIAAAHSFDYTPDFPYATLAHTDITPTQFILIGGKYKLNDFNRSRFIRWNKNENAPCSYRVGRNPGKFRSPEEYSKPHVQTEKVDVYSMGNIYYTLLTRMWPFDYEQYDEEKAQSAVKKGKRPHVPSVIMDRANVTVDPALFVVVQAMRACYEQDVVNRPSAVDVRDYLKGQLDVILQGRGMDVEAWRGGSH